MDDSVTVDDSFVGKRVRSSEGDEVGLVSGVRRGTLYVDPDPGAGKRVLATLGWDDVGQTDYPLGADAIDRVTEDAIHLTDP